MIKVAKYEFNDEAQANSKIEALGVDEDGNPTHPHAIVTLGNIVITEGEYDIDGNEITAPVLSDRFHVDVMWVDQDSHPYGWASYAVTPSDEGIHSFYGVDYTINRL